LLILFFILGPVFFPGCQKREKFPVYLQDKPAECGAVCLQMIFDYYGKHFSRDYLIKITKTDDKEGTSMLELHDAAKSLDFNTMGVRITYDKLRDEVLMPCILHWRGNHFVVLYKIKKKSTEDILCIADPAIGLKEYTKKYFCENWFEKKKGDKKTGLALLLEPTDKFYNIQEK
jgi:ATP-binding cassette subfamily B protein